MARRFTVMGFTEAELGFVLAAVFAALAVSALVDRDTELDRGKEATEQTDKARKEKEEALEELERTTRQLKELQRAHVAATEELERIQASLAKKSTKVPQCWEKGEQSSPIAELRILGENLYELDGEQLTLEGVRQRLDSFIDRGRSLGCRFVVRAIPTRGVDTFDHSRAVWQLRRNFDVNDRPP